MKMKAYDAAHQKKIEFPLGGIGTGCVSLTGIGELINWEFFGRPNKESTNTFSHFAVKAERGGQTIDARVMHGDIQEDFFGHGHGGHHSWGYGHGPQRTTLCGLPHFADTMFYAAFPFARVDFGKDFPGEISLEAFNPFIPSDEKASSIPAAFFTVTIHNSTPEETTYTAAFSCANPLGAGTVNRGFAKDGLTGILMTGDVQDDRPSVNGSVSIATDAEHASVQEYWYRGAWFDELEVFWQDFNAPGDMPGRSYQEPGQYDVGTLSASVTLRPYETRQIRFLLSWYVPTTVKTWGGEEKEQPRWNSYVCRLFDSHEALYTHAFSCWDRLRQDSCLFAEALSETDLPESMLESVSNTLAVLKSPTCRRLENGEFYAFEGTNIDSGSCEGSCDHVWNYAYALPFLFPSLERSMRELDFQYNQMENGGMKFRLMLPPGSPGWEFRPCVDGEMGGVIKFYRDWKICGDDAWLKKWWPKVQRSLEFAWSPDNPDRWDPDHSGILTGRQHHTLDVELFGPNSWLNGMYLAALKAGAEICTYLGDTAKAEEYLALLKNGQQYLESVLFNGKYYVQKLDLHDKAYLDARCGTEGCGFYWDTEKEEAKYQYLGGCEIDQMLGQWHASVNGLGDIFDPAHCKTALASLYASNFRSMRDVFNPCRVFCVNDEQGMLICTWPDGEEKPRIPVPYSEECWTGQEYAIAGQMLISGMEREAVRLTDAVRDRYDGCKRNPFSEIECGSSYARSMSAYSLLLLASGFRFDMTKGIIGFRPVHLKDGYKTFWSTDGAWGTASMHGGCWTLEVLFGKITLSGMELPGNGYTTMLCRTETAAVSCADGLITFAHPVTLAAGDAVVLA